MSGHRVSPVLAGRERELETVVALHSAAVLGSGTLTGVTGEAGVGKSRLILALGDHAEQAGTRVVTGTCFEHHSAVPYAPVAEVLRAAISAFDDADAAARIGSPDPFLLRLVPELADGGNLDRALSDVERHRVAQAFCGFVEREARGGAIVVVLEDLHWADAGTVELLPLLARRARAAPILVVITYRSDDLIDRPDLVATLAELQRKRLMTALSLAGLTLAQVEQMVRAILGARGRITPDFVDAVHERTDGNPLFVEELVGALIETGEQDVWDRHAIADLEIPPTIEQAILHRAGALPDGARALLQHAAVLGQRFELDAVRALAGSSESVALSAARTLVDRRLLNEDPTTGELRFHHALTRDAIYGHLLVAERRTLHRQAAETLARVYSERLDEHAGEIALHHAAAGDDEGTRRFALRAAEYATSVGGMTDARGQYELALRLTTEPRERAELLRTLGRLDAELGDMDRSIENLHAAASAFAAIDDRRGQARALLDMSRSVLMNGDRARSLSVRMSVLELLEPEGECVELAAAYRALGSFHMLDSGVAPAVEWSERAIALGRRLGAEETVVAATIDLGSALGLGSEPDDGVRHLRKGLAAARRDGWANQAARGYQNLGHLLTLHGRDAEAVAELTAGIEYCAQSGLDFSRMLCTCHLGGSLRLLGRWTEAEEHLAAVLAVGIDQESRKYLLLAGEELGALRADQGRWGEAARLRDMIEPLALERDELQHVAPLRTLSARIAMAGEDSGAAWRELDALRAYWRERADDTVFGPPALTLACELGARTGEVERVAPFHADLARAAPNALSAAAACLAEADGHVALATGDPAAAARSFETALAAWERFERPFDRARALRLLGEARTRSSAPDAAGALHAARTVFLELGAGYELKLTEAALRRAGERIPHGPRAATRAAPGGLTARETEVARLVADGRTNAEIARSLVIAPRTAAAHVGHILTKLGFSSRAQIAHWVAEQDAG
jgi:DNA-binding CsgD family transcriptional regulator